LGVPASAIANALSLPRYLDSFADPTIGYLSDNACTRWGRRRPFILAGAIPLAVLAYCLWLPGLAWSKSALAWYISGATLLYYLAYALFIVPYRALGFELTSDYHERTRVQGWGMVFGLAGGLGIPWLYKLALVFGGVDPQATKIAPEVILHGVRWVGLGVAVIILITCSAPALLCRERLQGRAQEKISILPALTETLKNWPFFNMLFARTFALIATFAVTTIGTPLMIYYLYGGNQSQASTLQGCSGDLLFAGAGIGIPFNTWMSARLGKRHAFVVCLALAGAGCFSQWLTYRPEHPYWILASNFLLGFGLQGVWLMCQSMVADVCDEDEVRTGRRREGIYGATYALMEKLGITTGFYLAGVIATICGYSAGIPSAEVLHRMWLAAILVPVFGMLLSGLLILCYPLTHQRMREIRRKLDARHAAR
jgi:glycoside/pentoside/hexuronide:cation symporter, GPH family